MFTLDAVVVDLSEDTHAASAAVPGLPASRRAADGLLAGRGGPIRLQHLGRGDAQWRAALHGGRCGRGHVRGVLRHEDRAARPDRTRPSARRRTVPRLRACSEPRQHRLQRARRYSAGQRPRRRTRARLGHSLAGQHGLPGFGVLHRREIDLLGRLVPAIDQRRPHALAGRYRPVSRRSLHRRRERDRRRARDRFHLRRAGGGAAGCMRERRGAHTQHRHVTWHQWRRDRSARGAGKPACVGPLQLRQVQQPSGARGCHPRRCRRVGRKQRGEAAVPCAACARNQAARRERDGAHGRSRGGRPTPVPVARERRRRSSWRPAPWRRRAWRYSRFRRR